LTLSAIVPLNKFSQEFSPIEKHFDEIPGGIARSGRTGISALIALCFEAQNALFTEMARVNVGSTD
jgi:hypothetical protein